MNTSPSPADPVADAQASLWAARLDGGSLSSADRAALDAWLAASPAHRALLSGYCQFSADLEAALPALVRSGAVALPAAKKKSRRLAPVVAFAGCSLAAAAALAFALLRPRFETVASPAPARQSVVLADGTHIEVDAHTRLDARLRPDERRVRLLDGEAFFAVAKDPARPFFVETPGGVVRVTGTAFDVRAVPTGALDVTVVEGSVQVRPAAGEPVALLPGDRLTADATGVTQRALSAAAMENALAWRRGQVVFDRTPLREALARFARHHRRVLTVSPGAASLTIGGPFALADLDGFLAALPEALPVRVVPGAAGAAHVTLRNER